MTRIEDMSEDQATVVINELQQENNELKRQVKVYKAQAKRHWIMILISAGLFVLLVITR
jgi:CHASE3 domain sensor protein